MFTGPAAVALWRELPPLGRDEVHVWHASLVADVPCPPTVAEGVLSPDELQRARRCERDDERTRQVAARMLLRRVVGSYLGMEPSRVAFTYGRHGKPYVLGRGGPPVHVSLSRSGDRAVVAVSAARGVGVDLEAVRPLPDLRELAAAYCSTVERSHLAAHSPDTRAAAFLRLWSRKEACLKAAGAGLLGGLDALDVHPPGECAVLLPRGDGTGRAVTGWLTDLEAPSGHVAALAVVGGRPATVRALGQPPRAA